MKSRKSRIQPFRGDDGNYQILYEFAQKMLPELDERFGKQFEKGDPIRESEPWVHEILYIYYGSKEIGYLVTHKIGFEPKYGGHAEDRVIIKALGLPSGMQFEMECTRYYHNPRFLEMRLYMAEEISEEFVRAFRKEFKQEKKLTPEEIGTSLQSARSAVVNNAWSDAEMHARLVLKTDPLNPDALFYLGVSLAAQGDEGAGEEYLTRALNHDPTNYDIYYNLGLIYMRRKEYEEAIALYTRGLYNSEDNHAIHFQIAQAFEAAGKIEHAIKHYQKAVDTSPNPDGAWHYTGMDFTQEAREALKRLT